MMKFKKRIWKIIIIAVAVWAVLSVLLTKFIYDFTFSRYDGEAEIPASLQSLAAERELVEYPCGDHLLCGYFYRGGSEGLVVLAPGYRAGADDYLPQIESLLSYGWSVFAFDATGSCRSEGRSAVGFSQILADLEATLDYVQAQDRFGCGRLFLMGHSRGAYGVCGMLDEGYEVDAVVSINGVNSSMEAIMQPAQRYVGPIAYGNYPLLWGYQRLLFGRNADFEASAEIAAAEVPVLIVQGEGDETFPPEKYSIYAHRDEIPEGRVEYYLCAGGHTDLLFDESGANDALMDRIHSFLNQSKEK